MHYLLTHHRLLRVFTKPATRCKTKFWHLGCRYCYVLRVWAKQTRRCGGVRNTYYTVRHSPAALESQNGGFHERKTVSLYVVAPNGCSPVPSPQSARCGNH